MTTLLGAEACLAHGQLGSSWVVRFERSGPKVLLVANNPVPSHRGTRSAIGPSHFIT
jgi:hypothetical protein